MQVVFTRECLYNGDMICTGEIAECSPSTRDFFLLIKKAELVSAESETETPEHEFRQKPPKNVEDEPE
jgi:hypothetical protein